MQCLGDQLQPWTAARLSLISKLKHYNNIHVPSGVCVFKLPQLVHTWNLEFSLSCLKVSKPNVLCNHLSNSLYAGMIGSAGPSVIVLEGLK